MKEIDKRSVAEMDGNPVASMQSMHSHWYGSGSTYSRPRVINPYAQPAYVNANKLGLWRYYKFLSKKSAKKVEQSHFFRNHDLDIFEKKLVLLSNASLNPWTAHVLATV